MPLAGALDIRPLLDGTPTAVLPAEEVHIGRAQILQVMYELSSADTEGLVPPALNPTIPPVISFLTWKAEESPWGPFGLCQVRVTARAAVRPRAFLVAAACDNESAAAALSGSFGFSIRPAEIGLRVFHDRVSCTVVSDRRTILDVALVDPEPVSGKEVQYPPGMHLARLDRDGLVKPRLIQVDIEYVFHRADRGRPDLRGWEPSAWSELPLSPVEPVSASFTACDVSIPPVHYVCNPDIPAAEGTEKV